VIAVTMEHSRYRPEATPDYSHRFHAGNIGDVWKHCALIEVLRHAAASARHVTFIDTHAGEGSYRLGPTGEWSEGVGRLWTDDSSVAGDDSVARYLALCRRLGSGVVRPERYPGSPMLARATLGADAPLSLWERDPATAQSLRENLRGDARARIEQADGLTALSGAVSAAESTGDGVVVLIDPPWTQKSDWTLVPDALARAFAASSHASFLLWYPVKSLTRPNAMFARLAAAGIAATIAELITTPLEHQRQRLNGSGVLLVRPPSGLTAAIAAAAPVIGERCATRAGTWSFRMQSWTAAS
jgi:23S rRNA (adenine2030-N6)-methyltransferase